MARPFVADFVTAETAEMNALFCRCLRVIEHSLGARREYMTKEGQIIYGGPDHYARLAATKHFRDSLAAGRPAPKHAGKQERKTLTYQELKKRVEENEMESESKPAA